MRKSWSTLQDRRVLITGGSRGLGLALAHACGQRGAHLALLARDRRALGAACDDLRRRFGRDVEALACDLRDHAEIERALAHLLARWRRLDVLINNAGIVVPGPAEQKSIDEYVEAMAVHFWAPLHAMRAVLPLMRAQGGGRIVNVSSVEGKVALPFIAPYSASKFALTGLSNALRAELARERIYITTVAPGLMRPPQVGTPSPNLTGWISRAAALPGVSTRYDDAAGRIVRAFMAGKRWLELDLLSRCLMRADAVAPELVGALMEGIGRVWGRRAQG